MKTREEVLTEEIESHFKAALSLLFEDEAEEVFARAEKVFRLEFREAADHLASLNKEASTPAFTALVAHCLEVEIVVDACDLFAMELTGMDRREAVVGIAFGDPNKEARLAFAEAKGYCFKFHANKRLTVVEKGHTFDYLAALSSAADRAFAALEDALEDLDADFAFEVDK